MEEILVTDQAQHDRRIDYLELATTDIAETKRFYHAVFGWEFQDWGPGYAGFDDGRMRGGFTTDRAVGQGPLVVLYAADLEAIEALVVEHGGEIARATFDFPGGRRFHFADPSGNELAVWSEQRP
jgi:uncharacterized protein